MTNWRGDGHCIRGLLGLKQIVESSERRRVFADGDDVCLVYDLITNMAGTIPTAGWFQLRGGKIAAMRVFFEPGPSTPR